MKHKIIPILIGAILGVSVLGAVAWVSAKHVVLGPMLEDVEQMEQDISELMIIHEVNRDLVRKVTNLQIENRYLQDRIEELEAENEQLQERIEELEGWIEQWDISEAEVTKYAPLDPNAVEGMCYSGDPNITASGARVVIGYTAAAGPDIPFGTLVMVEGLGIYEVQDRGGGVANGAVDLATASRKTAYTFGRQVRKVMYRKK